MSYRSTKHVRLDKQFWNLDYDTWWDARGLLGSQNDYDGDRLPNGFEDITGDATYNPLVEMYDFSEYATYVPYPGIGDEDDHICREWANEVGNASDDWGDPGMNHLGEAHND